MLGKNFQLDSNLCSNWALQIFSASKIVSFYKLIFNRQWLSDGIFFLILNFFIAMLSYRNDTILRRSRGGMVWVILLDVPQNCPYSVGRYCSIQRNIQQYYQIPPRLCLGYRLLLENNLHDHNGQYYFMVLKR